MSSHCVEFKEVTLKRRVIVVAPLLIMSGALNAITGRTWTNEILSQILHLFVTLNFVEVHSMSRKSSRCGVIMRNSIKESESWRACRERPKFVRLESNTRCEGRGQDFVYLYLRFHQGLNLQDFNRGRALR